MPTGRCKMIYKVGIANPFVYVCGHTSHPLANVTFIAMSPHLLVWNILDVCWLVDQTGPFTWLISSRWSTVHWRLDVFQGILTQNLLESCFGRAWNPGILACLWVPFLSTKCLNEESGFFWNYLLCLHHIALRRGGGDPNQRSRPQESLKSWRFGHYNEDGDERFCKLWMSSSEDSCNLSLAIDPVNWICPILAWRRGFCGATRTCFLRNCA